MKWTSEPPAEPGWYWQRTGPDAVDPPTVVEVVAVISGTLKVRFGDEIDYWDLDMAGQWAGPLVPPE